MANINYFSGIVKILETPRYTVSKKKIGITKFRVELPQVSKNKVAHLLVWGNLATNVRNSYDLNDYLLIEGDLRIQKKKLTTKHSKKIVINVSRIYPFKLNLE